MLKAGHGTRHAICEHLQPLERAHCDFDLTNEAVPIELYVIDTFDRMTLDLQLKSDRAAAPAAQLVNDDRIFEHARGHREQGEQIVATADRRLEAGL